MNALLRRCGMALLVVLGCSGSAPTSEVVGQTGASTALSDNAARTITILHVNDSHSVVDAIGPKEMVGEAAVRGTLGGLTKAATVIAGIRATTPNTLLLHGGDVFEGDLTFVGSQGVLELGLLKGLGLDAFTLGNHEFDYGPDLLASTLTAAGLAGTPVLSANLMLKNKNGPHPLSSLVSGHVVKETGGVRVGIFGLTTPFDQLVQTGPFELSDHFLPIVRKEVAALRAAKADVVILLSHLPGDANRAIAAYPMNGIDFIVAAHDEIDETFAEYTAGQTAIVQAGHFYQKVGRLDLTVRKGNVVAATHMLIPVDATVERLAPIAEAVDYVEGLVNGALFTGPPFPPGFDAFHTPIAQAEELANLWTPAMGARRDLGVGSLAADALKAKFDAPLGVTTSGFLNDKIEAGFVTANDLFRALPYGINPAAFGAESTVLPDPAVMISVNGAQLYTGLEVGLAFGEIPQVSDGTFVCFDLSAPVYQRFQNGFVLIDGTPVLPTTTGITVATNVVLWQILNQASQQAELGDVALLSPIEASTTQFSALLEYATEKFLVNPSAPRVKNLPGAGCDAWKAQLLAH